MGGVIYSFPRWYYVRPYAKFVAGLGGIDFPNVGTISHPYSHDTFLVTALRRRWRCPRHCPISGSVPNISSSSGTRPLGPTI